MDFFHRQSEKMYWVVAGLIGASVASWWQKDDLTSEQA
jgi:hypothetical protein